MFLSFNYMKLLFVFCNFLYILGKKKNNGCYIGKGNNFFFVKKLIEIS